jgi:hypothetical protein
VSICGLGCFNRHPERKTTVRMQITIKIVLMVNCIITSPFFFFGDPIISEQLTIFFSISYDEKNGI